jgi:serine/threonine protein kinase/WD40 repeat protein
MTPPLPKSESLQNSPHWDEYLLARLEEFESALHRGSVPPLSDPGDLSDCPPEIAAELRRLQSLLLWVENVVPPSNVHSGANVKSAGSTTTPDSEPQTLPLPSASHRSSPDQSWSDLRMGRFELGLKLGEGTYGIVYLAQDPRLKRLVALKIPRLDAAFREDLRERFIREGESAARLTHPNIVTVFEAVSEGPVSFIASEYIPGPNLATWLTEHSSREIPPREAARLIADLAAGVAHAHAKHVLHRDIKPSNILLAPKQSLDPAARNSPDELDSFEPKLTDFGLAKLLEHQDATLSGVIVGTPAYMPPEQIAGRSREIGPAVDIYSLGLVLYELLTGGNPFLRESVGETIHAVTNSELPPLRHSRPDLARDLETIILKCLRRDQKERYASAMEFSEDLHRYLEGRPIRARQVTRLEHYAKWCRRNPALAIATTSVFVLLLSSTIGYRLYSDWLQTAWITAMHNERRAEDQARIAQEKTREAQARTDELLRRSYVDDIQMATKAWLESNTGQVLKRLGKYIPKLGETDLRTFPWWMIWRSIQESSEVLTRHEGGATAVAVQPSYQLEMRTGLHAVAIHPSGWYVIAWEAETRDGYVQSIAGQRFTADGKAIGPQFHLSDGVSSSQRGPLVEMDEAGNFMIAWHGIGKDNKEYSVSRLNAQKFDASGNRLGDTFRIDTNSVGLQFEHDFAMGPGGELIVSWVNKLPESQVGNVFCQRFSSSGIPLSPEIKVNSLETNTFTSPAVAMNPQGDFFVTWIGQDSETKQGWHVWGRSFSENGNPHGSDFRVQSDLNVGALQPDIACDGNGQFAIAWCGLNQIFLRRFRANGEPIGVDQQVSSDPSQIHQSPKLRMNVGGETVVVWQAASRNDSRSAILAQRYDAADRTSEKNFIVAESAGMNLIDPTTGIDAAGRFVVNYLQTTSKSTGALLQSQQFDASSQPIGQAVSVINQLVATGGQDGTIRLFSYPALTLVAELKGHTKGPIQGLQFHHRGSRNWLLSAADDGTARLWDLNELREIRMFQHSDWLPVARLVGENAERVATGGSDGIIRIWDPLSGMLEREIKGHSKAIRALCDNPEFDLLLSSSEDDLVRAWHWRIGEPDRRTPEGIIKRGPQAATWSSCMKLSPDRGFLAIGYRDGKLNIICLHNTEGFGSLMLEIPVAEGVRSIDWVDDRNVLVGVQSQLQQIEIRDGNMNWLQNGFRKNLPGHRGRIRDVALLPGDPSILAADEAGDVRYWPQKNLLGDIRGLDLGSRDFSNLTYAGSNGDYFSIVYGKHAYVINSNEDVPLFQVASNHPRGGRSWHCPLKNGAGIMLAEKIDDRFVFSAYPSPIQPNAPTGPALWQIPIEERDPDQGICSPDGRLVALCCNLNMYVIDTSVGKTLFLQKHPAAVTDVQFTPDGRNLLSACADGKLRTWRVADGELLDERQVHSQSAMCLSISQDGTLIATGGEDRTVIIWRTADFTPLHMFPTSQVPERLSFMDESQTLAVRHPHGTLSFWSIQEQVELLSLEPPSPRYCTFLPDRSSIVVIENQDVPAVYLLRGSRKVLRD